MDGKTYGAVPGRIVLLDDDGSIQRTYTNNIQSVGGIAPFLGGTLIVGDAGRGSIIKLDLSSGQFSTLVMLSQINTSGFTAGNVIRDGKLSGLVFDGMYVYASFSAGFISYLNNWNTFISTSCSSNQSAWVSKIFYEYYPQYSVVPTLYHHGVYNYRIISVLNGSLPSGTAVNADYNSNGKVSALETHSWREPP